MDRDGQLGFDKYDDSWFVLRRVPGPPSDRLPPTSLHWPGRGPVLVPVPSGLYVALYGPHGTEVLSIAVTSPEESAPPQCPVHGVFRIEGRKLIGDPNVPASK